MTQGKLIVFEGIDGSGKTTLARHINVQLQGRCPEVLLEREPTDGQHGQRLRESARTGRLPLADEVELFLADRREHVEQVIAPALARGAVVLLDRYIWSTVAYQSARGADPVDLVARNREFPEADLTVLLDLSPERALDRTATRLGGADEFERIDYLESVRRTYLRLYQQSRRRMLIDAAQLREKQVADLAWESIRRVVGC